MGAIDQTWEKVKTRLQLKHVFIVVFVDSFCTADIKLQTLNVSYESDPLLYWGWDSKLGR